MKTISPITIKKSVESAFNRSIDIKTRKRDVIYMRCIYYRLCRDLTYESLESIGKQVNKDHATVLHACKTVNNLIDTDKQFRAFVNDIEKKLTLN